jgi:hypothetical protein
LGRQLGEDVRGPRERLGQDERPRPAAQLAADEAPVGDQDREGDELAEIAEVLGVRVERRHLGDLEREPGRRRPEVLGERRQQRGQHR